MQTPKPAGRRRGLLVAAAVVLFLLAALWLVASSLVSAPPREVAIRPPAESAEPPAAKPVDEAPDGGALPAQPGEVTRPPPKEATRPPPTAEAPEAEPVIAPPEPPPADMPAPMEPGDVGPAYPQPGSADEWPPADMPAPAELPPVPAEGGFADYDKTYDYGGGGGVMIPGSSGGGGNAGAGAGYPDIDDIQKENTDDGVPVAPSSAPVERFPYLDAPEAVAPGEPVTVSVALTLDQLTPGVTAKPGPGATLTPEGALGLPLPEGVDRWTIDVDLVAPGFDAAEGTRLGQSFVLYRDDDSDFVRFDLRVRPTEKPGSTRRLAARFYHQGRFLGSAARPIAIAGSSTETGPSALTARAAPPSAAVEIGGAAAGPDLDMLVQFDDPAAPRRAAVYIHSPHIAGPVVGEWEFPAGAAEWIDAGFARLVTLGAGLRSARALALPEADDDPDAQRRRVVAFAEGFGDELYRRYVPGEFRRVFEQLRRDGKLGSILVSSNSPVIPWELVHPAGDNGAPGDFLGLTYRLARWTPRDSGDLTDRPGGEIAFDGIAAVAPHYADRQALPFQKVEIGALAEIDGYASVGGDFSAFAALMRNPARRFIHFSGHGAIGDPAAGEAPFSILLEDLPIDPTTWRQLASTGAHSARPLYFFNACDSGAAKVMGGFVQGWGTTVLESGASGFIGGMWPLADEGAAAFAAEYYIRLAHGLARDRVFVADVLREVRRGFYRTGDPTFLAYTFYGDPNLSVVRTPSR